MFIAIPLETKPSWRSPPWMTVLLILINCAVYFGWQVPEEQAVQRAGAVYTATPLPAIELPEFVRQAEQKAERSGKARERERAAMMRKALDHKTYGQLYQAMWHEGDFRARLAAGQVIRPDDPRHADWQAARVSFNPMEPREFTARWSQNHDADADWRPITWLTNTFLHGSVGHLLGNMVFLFLFGFTLEMALGAPLYLLCYLLGGMGASALAAWAYAGMGGLGLGASGAVAALMGMYAVLYRLKRIRFFYMLAFYFNYARWPALVMLPVWMGYELLQHFMGGPQVAYMAHLGGLITGALLMAAVLMWRPIEAPDAERAARPADPREAERADELRTLTDRAKALAQQLRFADAAPVWEKAARLAPRDAEVLQAWFTSARHAPASDGFHAAARLIFKLPANDAATRQLQLTTYQQYLQHAKPGVRLSADTMQRLVRSFVAQAEFRDAEALAKSLARMNPPPEGWPATLEQLAAALAKAGRLEAARGWLPDLQRVAPAGAVTRWLQGQGGAAR